MRFPPGSAADLDRGDGLRSLIREGQDRDRREEQVVGAAPSVVLPGPARERDLRPAECLENGRREELPSAIAAESPQPVADSGQGEKDCLFA